MEFTATAYHAQKKLTKLTKSAPIKPREPVPGTNIYESGSGQLLKDHTDRHVTLTLWFPARAVGT